VKRLAVACALAACLAVPCAARADGDPASDFLITQKVFLPYGQEPDSGAVKELQAVVEEANKRGFKIRVAVIAQPADLGTAFALFKKPDQYARFLGQELVFLYRGGLLIAMPNGFGFARAGAADPKLAGSLKRLPAPGNDATKLVQGASDAVLKLSAAAGHPFPRPKVSNGDSQTRDRIVIACAAVIVLALVAIAAVVRRSRRRAAA
jgi:hypothetical protein